jgi:Zn-dependent oligopeptidase
MSNVSSVRLSADMSLDAITKEIAKLDGSNGRLQQKSKIENGVEVVYLRRTTAKDSIKNLFMSSAKRKESREPAFNLIRDRAKAEGLDANHSLMNNIKTSLKSGASLSNGLESIKMYIDNMST